MQPSSASAASAAQKAVGLSAVRTAEAEDGSLLQALFCQASGPGMPVHTHSI